MAIAAATFGLVMGSVIGGPIARYLIDKDNLSVLNVCRSRCIKLLLSGRKLMLSIKNISFRYRSAFGGNGYRFLDHGPDNIF
ncbi:MAG: sodium/glutamate symporter [Phascolarctobacterium faecium]